MSDTFISYAQNAEDVVLWRALRHVSDGRYVDVGAWDAVEHSVTKAFYDRGWRGVDIEPVPELAAAIRRARPGDDVLEVAITAGGGDVQTLHRVKDLRGTELVTGLSTLVEAVASSHQREGFTVDRIDVPTQRLAVAAASPVLGHEVHFLKVDVEGAERGVLESMDFDTLRPWVIVVEARMPLSTQSAHEEWEHLLVGAGYEFCLFDGLSRFYVAREHAELKPDLSFPACVLDDFVPAREVAASAELAAASVERDQFWHDLLEWRSLAVDAWSDSFGRLGDLEETVEDLEERLAMRRRQVRKLRRDIRELRESTSWRLTGPLRRASGRVAAVRGGGSE